MGDLPESVGFRPPSLHVNSCSGSRSSHTDPVDVQLNNTMRLITGTLRPTQLQWLRVLANIAPANLRLRHRANTMNTHTYCNFVQVH